MTSRIDVRRTTVMIHRLRTIDLFSETRRQQVKTDLCAARDWRNNMATKTGIKRCDVPRMASNWSATQSAWMTCDRCTSRGNAFSTYAEIFGFQTNSPTLYEKIMMSL